MIFPPDKKGKPRIRVSQLTAEPLKDEKARRGLSVSGRRLKPIFYIYIIYIYTDALLVTASFFCEE
jgi:hypothetical protein